MVSGILTDKQQNLDKRVALLMKGKIESVNTE